LLKESIPYRAIRAAAAVRVALMNGFTTVKGDPIADISELTRVSFVMKGGAIYKQ